MSDLQAKQLYLRLNIIDAGYSPEEFLSYLEEINGSSSIDLESWNMNRLVQIVEGFKAVVLARHTQNAIQVPYETPERATISTSHSNSSNNMQAPPQPALLTPPAQPNAPKVIYVIIYERYDPVFDYETHGVRECKQSDPDLPSKMVLIVPEYKTKERSGILFSIGARTELYFIIKSSLSARAVTRLYEDIVWVCHTLTRLYPYAAIPAIPEMNKGDNETKYEVLRLDLEQYLQHIVSMDSLKYSRLLKEFLTTEDENLSKLKQAYDNLQYHSGIGTLRTKAATVDIQLTNKARQRCNDIADYIKKSTNIHERLSGSIQKVRDNLLQLKESVNDVVDTFADLHEIYNDISGKYIQIKDPSYVQMLINLNRLFHGLSKCYEQQSNSLFKDVGRFFNFTLSHDSSIQRLQRYLKDSEREYLDFKLSLYRKKERLYQEPAKWQVQLTPTNIKALSKEQAFQVMLPKESKWEQSLRDWLGFLNTALRKQFLHYIDTNSNRYANKYTIWCNDLLSANKRYIEAVTEFLEESRKHL